MDAQLLIWIVERYSKEDETILDPMAGSGTAMLACQLGRNMVLVELEEKFVKMCEDNWRKVRQMPSLFSSMGDCQIVQGDARNLEGLLVDKCIFSPPFGESNKVTGDSNAFWDKLASQPNSQRYGRKSHPSMGKEYSRSKGNIGNLPYGEIDKIVSSPPYAEGTGALPAKEEFYNHPTQKKVHRYSDTKSTGGNYGDNRFNIGNLPYGEIDKIVSSPPFQEVEIRRSSQDKSRESYNYGSKLKMSSEHPDNISRLAENDYGNIDSIITSPPYEGSEISAEVFHGSTPSRDRPIMYNRDNENNIGNLKSDSYLEAMLQIYHQCYKVLKPQGLMILVTKNFIRNKKVVRLDLDTIRLCEQAGFNLLERHYRKLPAQSFWRILYHQKYPDVEPIEHEDILVFQKG